MKKLLTYLFIFAVFGMSAALGQIADFEKANKLYDQAEYQKALTIYDSLYRAGFENTAIAYNAANAYYRLGNLGMATVYYERALKHSPDDEDVLFNLEIVRELAIDEIKPLPKPLFVMWFRSVSSFMSWSNWMFASIALIWLAWIIHFTARWKGQRGIRWPFIALASLSVLLLVVAIESYTFDQSRQKAVVLDDTVYIKNEPNSSASDLFLLHEATVVEVRDEIGDWYKIWLEDGKVGWIEKTSIEKI